MKPFLKNLLLPFGFCLLTFQVQAQWQSTNYTLKGGWNAIYLHGEATYAPPATLFSANPEVIEVWRWNPNPNQVQFTTSPLLPTPGTPEWTVWKRDGSVTALTGLTGQNAYLVRCSGTSANTYTVTLPQRPLPPSTKWVRNGANLLGFPAKLNGSYPTFQNYFTAFPAAIAANVKIFKYNGGELSPSNPLQIFSPNAERLDRNQAYWFDSEVVGNFYAPIEISLSVSGGLDFGRTGSIITARVLNRTAAVMGLTIAPVASNAAPSGQETITGSVPVTRRTFSSTTAAWVETPIATAYTEVIAPQSSVELSFGIDRAAMTAGAPGALFASLLRLTDAGEQFDILLPVQARKTSLAGLWIGEATVKAVESKAQSDAITATGRGYPLRYVLHVADNGTARVLSQVFMGPMAAAPHDFGLCTKEIGLKADQKANARRIVSVHLPPARVLDGDVDPLEAAGSGSVAIPGSLTRTVKIPFNDPTNPFVHQYHPDHDNKSATGVALIAGRESYNIERRITFTFTATAAEAGSTVTTGWGSSVIGGTYAETVQGLHKDSTGVGTGNGLNLIGTFELRRASELGSLTVN